MSVSGLTVSPSRCCLKIPVCRSGSLGHVSAFSCSGKLNKQTQLPRLERCYWAGSAQVCEKQRTYSIKCAMDASYGDLSNGSTAIFPRINVRDPYKRLGISSDASEEEIQAARNFLVQKFAGHKPSVEAIESAHDKIIMQKFYERRNPKIDIKKKVREVRQSRVMQAVLCRRPNLQVAISLIATMYFIHDRLKSRIRALLYGVGAFIFSWLLGTFLMVAVIPPLPIIKGLRSFEVTTSLITYVLLWVSSTYLK